MIYIKPHLRNASKSRLDKANWLKRTSLLHHEWFLAPRNHFFSLQLQCLHTAAMSTQGLPGHQANPHHLLILRFSWVGRNQELKEMATLPQEEPVIKTNLRRWRYASERRECPPEEKSAEMALLPLSQGKLPMVSHISHHSGRAPRNKLERCLGMAWNWRGESWTARSRIKTQGVKRTPEDALNLKHPTSFQWEKTERVRWMRPNESNNELLAGGSRLVVLPSTVGGWDSEREKPLCEKIFLKLCSFETA